MAFDSFPKKKAGDRLSAGFINRLGGVARRVEASGMSSFTNGHLGGTVSGSTPFPQSIQVPVEITNLKITDDDEEDSGLYLCKIRYFEPDDSMAADVEGGEWELQDKEWRLDANATGLILAVGDKVSAYWHQQRGMFVPVSGLPSIYVAKPSSVGGIPGLENDDEPGKADCKIYKINDDGELEVVNDDDDYPEEKEVFNLSEATVAQEWILILKTMFGKWIALPVMQRATMISATVNETENVAATDVVFAINNVIIIAPLGANTYPDGTTDPPIECNNSLRIPAEDGAGVVAFYNNNTKLWEGFPQAYTTECP